MKFVVGCDLEEFKRYYRTLDDLHSYFKTLGLADVKFGELGEVEAGIIKRDPSHLIVWRENSKIIGHAIWHETNTEEHRKGDPREKEDRQALERLLGGKKDFVELHEIWLMTECRGRDYGKKFFDFFEAFLKNRGHDSIVYYANHATAIAICRQRGCKEEYLESIGEYVFYLPLRNTTKREIVIGDYDPQWPILYEKEREEILNVIGHIALEIEHMGSTAVQGLGAKPIIDIMVAIDHLSDTEKCIEPLRSIGYKYVPEHEEEIPWRRFFNKGRPPKEQHYHLHMVQKGSGFWKRHLLFRDYLRMHPNVAQQYYHLKKELASKYGVNREAYTSAKTSFIESIVAKAKRVSGKDKS